MQTGPAQPGCGPRDGVRQIAVGIGRPDDEEGEGRQDCDYAPVVPELSVASCGGTFLLVSGIVAGASSGRLETSDGALSMIAPGRAVTTTPSAISRKTRVWPSGAHLDVTHRGDEVRRRQHAVARLEVAHLLTVLFLVVARRADEREVH